MQAQRQVKRADLFALLALAAGGTALALALAPGSGAMWIGAATPAVVFAGYWLVVQIRLHPTRTVQWLEAYPARWRFASDALAVVGLVLALPAAVLAMVLPPVTWVALGCGVLAVIARDWIALGAAVVVVAIATVVVGNWAIQSISPMPSAMWVMAGLALALAVLALFFRPSASHPAVPR